MEHMKTLSNANCKLKQSSTAKLDRSLAQIIKKEYLCGYVSRENVSHKTSAINIHPYFKQKNVLGS